MDPREDADAFDFRDQWQADAAAGRSRALADYLARFPGSEARIAREWLLLNAPASKGPNPEAPAPMNIDADLVGPYRRQRLLGRGGQGEVWLAEDTRVNGRLVALKILDSGAFGFDGARCARLRREATALARLDHPGICPLLDADLDGPRPWLAMRYVRGRTLHATLAANPTPPQSTDELHTAIHRLERLALAAHAAHEAGILHRDIKPANVMLDQDGTPVLLDFGLARAEDQETLAMTRTGDVFGSLAYMAPEQVRGARDLDRRVDVYALGVTIYECLTGRAPFAALTSQATGAAILAGNCRPLRQINSALPRDLATVVATAMELTRDRRYATARALAEDLANVRERRPIRARPAGIPLRALRWVQRHPVAATALLVLSFALFGVSLLLGQMTLQARELLAWKNVDAASRLVGTDPAQALVAVTAAAAGHDSSEVRSRVHATLAAARQVYALPLREPEDPRVYAVSRPVQMADRATTVVGTNTGELLVWRQDDGMLACRMQSPGPSGIGALALSADGAVLLAGTRDGAAYLLDALAVANGNWRGTAIDADTRCVTQAVAATRATRFFVGGMAGRLQMLEAPAYAVQPLPLPEDRMVYGLWPSPDGHTLLVHTAAGRQGEAMHRTLFHIDVATGRGTTLLDDAASLDMAAEWTPDGSHFVAIEAAGRLLVGSVDGTVRWRLDEPGLLINARFSPDGRRLLTFGFRGLSVYDWQQQLLLHRQRSRSGRSFQDGWFSPDGTKLLVAVKDKTLRMFDPVTWQERELLGPTQHFPHLACWSPDGCLTVFDPVARYGYEFGHRQPVPAFSDPPGDVRCVVFAPDGRKLATASSRERGSQVQIRDLDTGVSVGTWTTAAPVRSLHAVGDTVLITCVSNIATLLPWTMAEPRDLVGHSAPIHAACAVGADSVLTVGGDGTARVWRLDGQCVRTFRPEIGPLHTVAVDPTNGLLAVAGERPVIAVLDLREGSVRVRLDAANGSPRFQNAPNQLHIDTRNGRLFAATPSDSAIHCWSLQENYRYTLVDPPGTSIGNACTDADGRWLIATEQTLGAVGLYDAATLQPLPWLPAWNPGTKVSRLQFAPNGHFALLASYDGTVRIFDLQAGRPWSELPDVHGGVLDAAFDPAGKRIAVAHADGSLRVWPVDPLPVARRHLLHSVR